MNWFSTCRTPEAIKARFRELVMIHHPDKGGDTRTMQDIIDLYHAALRAADGFESKGDDGKYRTYHYNYDVEQEIVNKINELLKLPMEGVEITLIGKWIWIIGNTRPYSKILGREGAGCSYHSKRTQELGVGCWYWKPDGYQTHYSGVSLDVLAARYGARIYRNRNEEDSRVPAAAG